MAGTSLVGQGVTPPSWVKRAQEQTPQLSKRPMRVGQGSLQCPLKPLGLTVKQQTCVTMLLKRNGAKSSARSASAFHVYTLAQSVKLLLMFLGSLWPNRTSTATTRQKQEVMHTVNALTGDHLF